MTQTETSIVRINEVGNEERGAALAGFQSSAAAGSAMAHQAGTVAAVAREEAEIKAAIVLARGNPRDEARAYTRIIQSCQRPTFAEGACYSFPRGGARVEGPSIDMARELARCWTNVRYGLRIVTEDAASVHIKGYAYDLEANNYVEAEDKFSKLIQRKNRDGGTSWVQPDERDLRELVNRRGAICVRNAILQLIPPDIIEDAVLKVGETMRKAAAGDLEQDRPAAIRRMVLAFANIQVTTEMLAGKIGNSVDNITDEQLAELRKIYASMRDGNSKREDHFEVSKPAAASAEKSPVASQVKTQAAALAAQLGSKQAKDSPATQEQGAAQGGPVAQAAAVAPPPVAGSQGSLLPPEQPGNGRRRS